MGYSDFQFKTPNAEVFNSITPGTVAASKAVITDANNKVNTLDITTPKFGGIAITSSAAELNLIDNSVAGTAVASKALVLGTNKNVDVLAVADLKLGADAGTSVTATAAELNYLDTSVVGTAVASKALVLGADKNVDVLAIADLKLGAGAGTSVTATAVQLNEAGSKASSACRLYNFGAPALADDDLIVTVVDMKVGSYVVAAQPEVPRNITVTSTAVGTADTMGTVTITGTNFNDEVISEIITPVSGNTVAGTKAFKTVTTVVGADWIIDGVEATADTIIVGTGNEVGLPLVLDSATEIMLGILGVTITATNPTVANPATIEGTTINMSAGTYNGTKEALVFVVD